MPSVELEGFEVGDRGEERALIYMVTYETKHDTFRSLHASEDGARERVLEIAEANVERWSGWEVGRAAVQKAIEAKDAEEVARLWTELGCEAELLSFIPKILDK